MADFLFQTITQGLNKVYVILQLHHLDNMAPKITIVKKKEIEKAYWLSTVFWCDTNHFYSQPSYMFFF